MTGTNLAQVQKPIRTRDEIGHQFETRRPAHPGTDDQEEGGGGGSLQQDDEQAVHNMWGGRGHGGEGGPGEGEDQDDRGVRRIDEQAVDVTCN